MILFKDRVLIIAILVSTLWHFLFIFSVKPVLPVGYILEHNTSIAFLGGILESVGSFVNEDSSPTKVGMESSKNKSQQAFLLGNEMDKSWPGIPCFINIQPDKKEFSYSPDDRSFLKLNVYRRKEASRVNFSDFFIRGPARDRVIIYKPDLDKIAMLPSDFNSDFSASIKFRISKGGFVKYVECIASSGFSEIDQLAMRHVRTWQFVPADEDNQEGVVRVSFK